VRVQNWTIIVQEIQLLRKSAAAYQQSNQKSTHREQRTTLSRLY